MSTTSTSASGSPTDRRTRVVTRLARAAEKHDGAAPFDEAVLLDLEKHGLPDQPDRVMVDDRAAAWLVPDPEDPDTADLHLVVDPSLRGQGIGEARLDMLLDTFEGCVRAWSHGDHLAARCLAEGHHFDRARALWVMRRPVEDLPPLSSLPQPKGVRLRHLGSEQATGGPDRDHDRDALLAVNAQAFEHHPEQGGLDVAAFEQRASADWFDPAGVLLAVDDDGALLGFHWTKLGHGPGEPGEIYVLGIAPEAQGRGLGTWLSLAGLHHLHQAGATAFLLYVEGDNEAAIATYEKLGFTHAKHDTHVQYVRPTRAPQQT